MKKLIALITSVLLFALITLPAYSKDCPSCPDDPDGITLVSKDCPSCPDDPDGLVLKDCPSCPDDD